MVPFEEILDQLEDMLDEAWNLPMTGGKCVLDGEKVREKLEGLRLNFPGEIKRAKAVLDERERIIIKAKSDAASTIKEAEEKAAIILNEQAIMIEAKEKAETMLRTAKEDSLRMKRKTVELIDSLLKRTEDLYDSSLATVKQARRAVSGEKE
jgi:hypothetical protein